MDDSECVMRPQEDIFRCDEIRKSITNKLNSKGPRIEPCAIPRLILNSENILSINIFSYSPGQIKLSSLVESSLVSIYT